MPCGGLCSPEPDNEKFKIIGQIFFHYKILEKLEEGGIDLIP
jgi:hypothetical protein